MIVLSVQDIKSLIDVDKQRVMPLYPLEIHKFLTETSKKMQQTPMIDNNDQISFYFIDCRIKKSLILPFSLDILPSIIDDQKAEFHIKILFIFNISGISGKNWRNHEHKQKYSFGVFNDQRSR